MPASNAALRDEIAKLSRLLKGACNSLTTRDIELSPELKAWYTSQPEWQDDAARKAVKEISEEQYRALTSYLSRHEGKLPSR